jgi:hypothetical protein
MTRLARLFNKTRLKRRPSGIGKLGIHSPTRLGVVMVHLHLFHLNTKKCRSAKVRFPQSSLPLLPELRHESLGAREHLNGWVLFGLTTAFLLTVLQKAGRVEPMQVFCGE